MSKQIGFRPPPPRIETRAKKVGLGTVEHSQERKPNGFSFITALCGSETQRQQPDLELTANSRGRVEEIPRFKQVISACLPG
jgi:hypothetical protein